MFRYELFRLDDEASAIENITSGQDCWSVNWSRTVAPLSVHVLHTMSNSAGNGTSRGVYADVDGPDAVAMARRYCSVRLGRPPRRPDLCLDPSIVSIFLGDTDLVLNAHVVTDNCNSGHDNCQRDETSFFLKQSTSYPF